jgi:hypothetical protein
MLKDRSPRWVYARSIKMFSAAASPPFDEGVLRHKEREPVRRLAKLVTEDPGAPGTHDEVNII